MADWLKQPIRMPRLLHKIAGSWHPPGILCMLERWINCSLKEVNVSPMFSRLCRVIPTPFFLQPHLIWYCLHETLRCRQLAAAERGGSLLLKYIRAAAWDIPIRSPLSTAQHPNISSSRLKGGSQLFMRCLEITFCWQQMNEYDNSHETLNVIS